MLLPFAHSKDWAFNVKGFSVNVGTSRERSRTRSSTDSCAASGTSSTEALRLKTQTEPTQKHFPQRRKDAKENTVLSLRLPLRLCAFAGKLLIGKLTTSALDVLVNQPQFLRRPYVSKTPVLYLSAADPCARERAAGANRTASTKTR